MNGTFINSGTKAIDYTNQLIKLNKNVSDIASLIVVIVVIVCVMLFVIAVFKKTNHTYEINMVKHTMHEDLKNVNGELKEIKNELKTLNKNIEKLIDKK